MMKFFRGKGHQPSSVERQKLQRELFAYKKVCIKSHLHSFSYGNVSSVIWHLISTAQPNLEHLSLVYFHFYYTKLLVLAYLFSNKVFFRHIQGNKLD